MLGEQVWLLVCPVVLVDMHQILVQPLVKIVLKVISVLLLLVNVLHVNLDLMKMV
jgi:hypothetical protein